MNSASRLKIVCSTIALLCASIASIVLLEMILPIFNPLWSVLNINCTPSGCHTFFDALDFLSPTSQFTAMDTAAVEATLLAGVQETKHATTLAIAEIIRLLPRFAFYLALGGAMLHFKAPKQFNHGAIKWLRYAAIAAVFMVLSKPIAQSLQETVIQSILGNGDRVRFAIVGSELPFDFFLVGILWISIWALEEGRRVQNELEEYV